MKMSFEEALAIACVAHNGQKDKCGDKYIYHPLYVSSLMDSEEDKIIALLHDVFEDFLPLEDLDALLNDGEISENAHQALTYLTRLPEDSYNTYLNKITNNRSAICVKLADLKHNSSIERCVKCVNNGHTEKKIEDMRKKYLNAIEFLNKHL